MGGAVSWIETHDHAVLVAAQVKPRILVDLGSDRSHGAVREAEVDAAGMLAAEVRPVGAAPQSRLADRRRAEAGVVVAPAPVGPDAAPRHRADRRSEAAGVFAEHDRCAG